MWQKVPAYTFRSDYIYRADFTPKFYGVFVYPALLRVSIIPEAPSPPPPPPSALCTNWQGEGACLLLLAVSTSF
jgi:hypothetical protein